MYQLHYFPANANAAPHMLLSRWARPMSKPPRLSSSVAKLLDKVTALPSIRRAYEHEGITDKIC